MVVNQMSTFACGIAGGKLWHYSSEIYDLDYFLGDAETFFQVSCKMYYMELIKEKKEKEKKAMYPYIIDKEQKFI